MNFGKNLWIVANWKSNKTIAEAIEWVHFVGPKVPHHENLKVIVCPDFTAISQVKKEIMIGGYNLSVGSQDISPFEVGSYTGEEPAEILSQFINFSIIGHSERRDNFKEDDDLISKKITQANSFNITPLLCVQNEGVQVPDGVKLIAFEPIFAIGTGNPDTPEDAEQVAKNLKGRHIGLEILYGGSVTAENAKAFLQRDSISGLLVGKASLDAEEFSKIVEIAQNI